MTIAALLADFRAGRRTPLQVIADLLSRRDAGPYADAWIHRVEGDALRRRAQEVESRARASGDLPPLEDGEWVQGFVCETWALEGAPDVSHFGGWRAYLASAKR